MIFFSVCRSSRIGFREMWIAEYTDSFLVRELSNSNQPVVKLPRADEHYRIELIGT